MKVKTSVTLSEEVVARLDATCGPSQRSQLIEDFIVEGLRRRERDAAREREIAILNRLAVEEAAEKAAFMGDAAPWDQMGSEFTE